MSEESEKNQNTEEKYSFASSYFPWLYEIDINLLAIELIATVNNVAYSVKFNASVTKP